MNILKELRSLLNAPHDTAVAREALAKALTGRVIPNPQPQPIATKEVVKDE